MSSYLITLSGNPTYSRYQNTIGDPTPPFKPALCVAYNGSYWIMGGYETVKETTLSTYQDVVDLQALYDSAFISARNTLIAKKISEKIEQYNPDGYNDTTDYDAQYTYYNNLVTSYQNQITAKIQELDAAGAQKINHVRKTLHTLAISYDGLNWTLLNSNPFSKTVTAPANYTGIGSIPRVNSVSWNGTMWVAVGNAGPDLNTIKSQIATSTDGINWTPRGSPGVWSQRLIQVGQGTSLVEATYEGEGRSVANGNNIWMLTGEEYGINLPFDEQNQTTQKLKGTIAKSTNGIDWVPISNPLTNGYTVAYNGATWVVGGQGGGAGNNYCLVTSSNNGTNWQGRLAYDTSTENDVIRTTINSIAWNGSYWLAVGEKSVTTFSPYDQQFLGVAAKSTNSVDWTIVNNIPNLKSVTWDGNFWLGVGADGLYKSKDGETWDEKTVGGASVYGFSVASDIVLPILGGTIQTVNSFIVGLGTPMSVLRSYDDDTNWLPQAIDGEGRNFVGNVQQEFFGVTWTGSKWIIAGRPINVQSSLRNLAISANGIDWDFPTNNLKVIQDVAYNGTTHIIVGEGETGYSKVSISSDASTWTSKTFSLSDGYSVAWNGSYWIAGGKKGTANAIVKSTNGNTWVDSTLCPLHTVYKVAWNGYLWVAVGEGDNCSIALSIDGIRWYRSDPATNPFTIGRAIAWNKDKWVAVGDGYNTIATSVDGYTWSGQGTSIFAVQGTNVAWNGSRWIISGSGYYPMASSTDGETWSIFNTKIQKVNEYANKDISLPYTGTNSVEILNSINLVVADLTSRTNDTILEEQAAAELAADEQASAAAAAAALALRNTTKAQAAAYRMKLLYWKDRINKEFSILSGYKTASPEINYNFLDLPTTYPYEYGISKGMNDTINLFVSRLPEYYTIIFDDEKPQSELTSSLESIKTYIDVLDSELTDYYNKTIYLYYQITQDTSSSVTSSQFESLLSNYIYQNNTQKNLVNNFYTTAKNAFITQSNSVKTQFNTTVSDVTYIVDISNYDYTPYVLQGETIDLSTITITNADFIGKTLDGFIVKSATVVGNQSATRSITFFINKILKTSAPDLYNLYRSAILKNDNLETLTNYSKLYLLNTSYKTVYDWQVACNTYRSDSITLANAWNAFVNQTTNEAEINNDFDQYYSTYFYTLVDNTYLPVPNGREIAVRFCKTVYESYTSPGAYPLVLGILYNSLKNTINTIDTIKDAAINYALNKKNTIIKAKLDTFKQDVTVDFNGTLQIDTYLNTLINKTYYSNSILKKSFRTLAFLKNGRYLYSQLYPLVIGVKLADLNAEADGAKPPKTGWGGVSQLSGRVIGSESLGQNKYRILTNGNNIADLQVGFSVYFYTQFISQYYNGLIQNYRNKSRYTVLSVDISTNSFVIQGDKVLFDETSVENMPAISFTTSVNLTYNFIWTFLLEGSDKGQQGGTGWDKFNETYFSRQKLADFIRIRNSFGRISGLVDDNGNSVFVTEVFLTWPEFLEFTRTATLATLIEMKTDLEQSVAQINSNLFLTTGYADNIVTQDLATIESYYPIQGQVVLTNIFNSVTIGSLPTQSDLDSYGNFKVLPDPPRAGTRTLQEYYDSISNDYGVLTNIKNTNIATYTTTQVKNIIQNALTYKGYLEDNQYQYTYLSQVLNEYKTKVADATNFVEKLEDRVNRYLKLYDNCVNGQSFEIGEEISGGSSKPFIVSISPSNTTYWTERTYPVIFKDNEKIEFSQAFPQLDPTKYGQYSSSQKYKVNDYARYNNLVYQCIAVGINDGDLTDIISGVPPTNATYWKQISYPIVKYNGIMIEAVPSLSTPLNHLDFGYYDNNWLYYEGDMVAYNGKVYECTNAVPPVSSSTITGIPPTNTSYWIVNDRQISSFGIATWANNKFYTQGTRVLYNGDIYLCEKNTIDFQPPTASLLNWQKTTILNNSVAKNIPREYSSTEAYSINSLVTYKSYNSNTGNYTLFIYRCYATTQTEPIPYTYPVFSISDDKDEEGDYIIKKESDGTYLLSNTPRHGPPGNDTDPFAMLGFARGLRRRVAMYIDMPYLWAKRLSYNASNEFLTSKYNFANTYWISQPGKTELYQSLQARVASRQAAFDNLYNGIYEMYDVAYSNLYGMLQNEVKAITALHAAINVIKTQYWNNPGTQTRVYDKPYKFLNPISDALSDAKRFRDLGVGDLADLKEREAETNYLFKTTQTEYDYYYTNQARIDEIEEDIYMKKFFCETIIGYDLLVRSAASPYQIGSVIYCDSAQYGIDVPITDYQGIYNYQNPSENSILGQITAMVKACTIPPEYVTDSNLAGALTWESSNKAIIGLSYFTKGLVGLTAAAFQAAVPDPFAIFGILNFVSGGKIPNMLSTSWPTFRDYTESKKAYKLQVNAIRKKYKVGTGVKGDKAFIILDKLNNVYASVEALNDGLTTLGQILNNLLFMKDDIDTNYRPRTEVITFTSNIPENPPPTYKPPKPPADLPEPPGFEFNREIEDQIKDIRKKILDVEEQKRILQGKKPRPPTLESLPKLSNQSQIAQSGNIKPKRWQVNGKFLVDGKWVDTGSASWQQKIGNNKGYAEKAIDTREPLVTQADIDEVIERNKVAEALYEKEKADWAKREFDLEQERANLNSDLDRTQTQLDLEEARAKAAEAEQDEFVRQRKENMLKYDAEVKEARMKYFKDVEAHRIAQQDLKDLAARNASVGALEEAQLNLKNKANAVLSSKVSYDSKSVTVTLAIQEYEDALTDEARPLSKYIASKIPANIKAKYAAAISKLGPFFSVTRRFEVILRNTAVFRFSAKVANSPRTLKALGALGVLAQVAGVGLTMWQSGVFDEEL